VNKVILSICIATRNRGAFIGATLESIVRQATDQVEIVIVDGASTDNTEEVVRRYQERFPRLHYSRVETNTGVDRDFARAVDSAQGDYCWLFSDDDLLKPGAIQVVLDALKDRYSLIVANSEVKNADLSTLLESKKLPFTQNRLYRSNENEELFIDTANYLSFIGCVIIERRLWDSREKEQYFGSNFVHVGVIFQKPLPGDALAIAEPLISIRYGNASWLGRYFEIWMFKWPGLIWSFDALADSAKKQVFPREPWRSARKLLHFRAKGAYTKREYAQWIKPHLESPWARLVGDACARFPGRAANLLVFIYYSIFHRPSSRLLCLSDLANSPFCFWRLSVKGRTPSRPAVISPKAPLPSTAAQSARVSDA